MPKSSIASRTPSCRQPRRACCSVLSASRISSALGHLELEAARRAGPCRSSALRDHREPTVCARTGAAERFTATRIARQPGVLPGLGLAAGLAQHPFADRHDQAGLLGDRDEVAPATPGRARGVLPAQQRLDADDRAGRRGRPAAGSAARTRRARARGAGVLAICRRSAPRRSSARVKNWKLLRPDLLGVVHRGVGVAASASRHLRRRPGRGDAELARDVQLVAVDQERAGRTPASSLARDEAASVGVGQLGQHERRTRRRPGARRCRLRAGTSRSRRDDLPAAAVAHGVAERIVDVLEAVEVDEQHRHLPAVRCARARSPGRGGRAAARGSAAP